MAAYLIGDTLLDDPLAYEEYKLRAKPIAESFGGEYIVRGGELDLRETTLWSPTRMVIIRFPDMAAARAFYDSPQYQEVLPISLKSARRTIFFVEGV